MAAFMSNRSAIMCLNGCAASTQPLATQIGLDMLKKGGNAADAAVAMAAALNVTEPCSTGLGGDAFCLFYDGKDKKVKAMNASGRSPANLTLDSIKSKGFDNKNGYPHEHGIAVTVPGAAAGWIDCIEKFGSGRVSIKEILKPAIKLARKGFPVAGPFTSFIWEGSSHPLQNPSNTYGKRLLVEKHGPGGYTYHPPKAGEIFKNPDLAYVMELLAEKGKTSFYEGQIAESIVKVVKKFGGVLEKQDLANNKTTFEDPISINYKGVTLWETAPNSQGLVALVALNILKNFELKQFKPGSAECLHLVIEALRLAFADGNAYCADPTKCKVPVSGLLSEEYGKDRANMIKMDMAISQLPEGSPHQYGSDTVYFTVVDEERNACSFINSNYTGFGTGIVPEGCGFSLQNRGANFSLQSGHPNVAAPNKRPYHTIIPAMVTDTTTGELLMSYGVMGKFMQPQGHVQVLLNCLEFNMDPQEALDYPRICVERTGGVVAFEEGISFDVVEALKAKGHMMQGPVKGLERVSFGKGQAIALKPFWDKNMRNEKNQGVMWAGSDPRSDGMAAGY